MTRVLFLLAAMAPSACAGAEVCLGRCNEAGLADETAANGSSSADASSDDVGGLDGLDTGDDDDASSDDASSHDDAPPDRESTACDPEDPCASLPATGWLYVDQCDVFGGTVFDDGVACEQAWFICGNYVRNMELGTICVFEGVVLRREELVNGVCDDYGEAVACQPQYE